MRREEDAEKQVREEGGKPTPLDYGTYPKRERSKKPFTWQQIMLLALPMLVLGCLFLFFIVAVLINFRDR